MFHSADANEPRDWRIYADFAQTLIAIARPLYRCWRQLQDGERPEVEVFGDRYLTPDGTAIRDYVHIIDLADAHVRALNFLQEPGHAEFLNLGTGHGYSVMQVIQAAREITGREIVLASSRLGLEIRRDWSRTTRGQRNCLAGRRHPIFARS
jgi:UDP-glucose 4-epimerase